MRDFAEFIARNYKGKVVEIGIGSNFKTLNELRKFGIDVIASDIRKTNFFVYEDDVCKPTMEIYRGAKLIYSIRPPYEIQKCIILLAKKIGCDAIIVPLKNEVIEGGKLVNYKSARFYIFTQQSLQALSEDLQIP